MTLPIKSILPDAMDQDRLIIIKACSRLRLTDEMRIAARVASMRSREFVLAIRSDCEISAELKAFVALQGVSLVRYEE